jgi:ribosome-associated protein
LESQVEAEAVRDAAVTALEDAKARDIKVMDVRGLTDVTEFMIIATGTSGRHVRSIAENLTETMKKSGHRPLGSEGLDQGEWVLIDLNDAIVHVMQADVRAFYDLETLWSDELRRLIESNREN